MTGIPSEITIRKKDLTKYIRTEMEIYLRNLLKPGIKNIEYNRLEGLIVYSFLDRLRNEIGIENIVTDHKLCATICDLNMIARHTIEFKTVEGKSPFYVIDRLLKS